VATALSKGYQGVDTAAVYGNEAGVGAAIKNKDVFITTKLWPGIEGAPAPFGPVKDYAATKAACQEQLDKLGVSAVDLYLTHAPVVSKEVRLSQWKAMIELKKEGKAKSIGVSNYSQVHIEELLAAGLEAPACNQIELHPLCQRSELVGWMSSKGIQAMSYSTLLPLGSWRSGKDEAAGKKGDFSTTEEVIKETSKAHGVSEAQVLFRWALQKGYALISKSANEARVAQNIDLFGFELSAEQMAKLDALGGSEDKAMAWTEQMGGDPQCFP